MSKLSRTSFRKTKLVATIGPASSNKEVIEAFIREGVDVFRINFSHGTHDEHQEIIRNIRAIADEYGQHVAILGDLQGPKIRVVDVPDDGIRIDVGDRIRIASTGVKADLNIDYPALLTDIQQGKSIYIDDGKIKLVVEQIARDHLVTRVVEGGVVLPKKGVNFPDSPLSVASPTSKDVRDLQFAIRQDVDWIALSFVRSSKDILRLKDIIDEYGAFIKVVAKIEKPEAVKNIESIIEVSDGVMVARGDLGVEMPMEEVPMIQKRIVWLCRKSAKPSIVATQVMESMVRRPTPSRAEVSDVANAVIDGADAIMLSNETSVGKYPVDVIKMVDRIIQRAEQEESIYYRLNEVAPRSPTFLPDIVCYNAAAMARETHACGIVGMTRSGFTAFKVASHRPFPPIFVFSDNSKLLQTLRMVWGVEASYYDGYESTDKTFEDLIAILKKKGYVVPNDVLIFTASMPIHQRGRTNTIHLRRIN